MPQIFIRLFIISLLMWTPFAQAQTVVGGQTAGRSTSPIPVYSTDIYGNPVSAGTAGTVGINQTTPGTTNGVIVNNTSLAVTGTFWQATQPVSFSGQTVGLSGSLPAFAATPTVNLGTLNGAAADGTDATGVTQLAGGVGIRGWLSGIYSKLSGTLAVSGTFWQATQPVSLATAPALVAGSAIVGKFGIDQTTPGTTNGVVVNNTSLPTTETYVNLATNQGGTAGAPISIGQSAVPIVAARAGRKEVTLILEAAVAVRIGGSGVTSGANGVLLQGIAGEAITISGGAAVYGYAPSGTAIVSALEVY